MTMKQDGAWKRNILWRSVRECDLVWNMSGGGWWPSESKNIILVCSILIVIFVSEVQERVLTTTYCGFKCKLEVTDMRCVIPFAGSFIVSECMVFGRTGKLS
jgi:hypothetical protein